MPDRPIPPDIADSLPRARQLELRAGGSSRCGRGTAIPWLLGALLAGSTAPAIAQLEAGVSRPGLRGASGPGRVASATAGATAAGATAAGATAAGATAAGATAAGSVPTSVGVAATSHGVSSAEMYVLGSLVNLRESSAEDAKVANRLRIGTRVRVLELTGALARVRSDAGDEGWLPLSLLTSSLPTVENCRASARASSTPQEALTWWQRAYELAPWDPDVLRGLEGAWRAAGEPVKADEVARKLDSTGPLAAAVCDVGCCRVWLELEAGQFQVATVGGPDDGVLSTIQARIRGLDGWFLLQEGRVAGWYTPTLAARTSAWQKGILIDDALPAGLMTSRLTRPIDPEVELPAERDLKDMVSTWMATRPERPAWSRHSRTGALPLRIRVLQGGLVPGGTAAVLELEFQFDAGEGGPPAGRYTGVLLARVTPAETLEVDGGEGLLDPAVMQGAVPVHSVRVRGIVDLDGDGFPEAAMTVMPAESAGGSAEVLWRAVSQEGRVTWRRELEPSPVRAAGCPVTP